MKSKNKNTKKTLLLAIPLLLVLFGLGFWRLKLVNQKNSFMDTAVSENTQMPQETINDNPATTEEKQSSEDNKERVSQTLMAPSSK